LVDLGLTAGVNALKKPYVIVGGFMSIDGKTAPKNRKGVLFTKFMSEELYRRLHRLRSEVDAILVGVGTALEDDPQLTVRAVKGKNPIRIVLDSKARIPLGSRVLNVKEAPTIIAVSEAAPKDKVEALRSIGVAVIQSGEKKVDIKILLQELYERGVRKLLVEGGAEVRWSFFNERLVDELFVWIIPAIWGGLQAPTLVGGEGYVSPEEVALLDLKRIEQVGEILVLTYTAR